MKFRILEGEQPILSDEDLAAFEDEYLNGKIRNYELRIKYNLSNKNFKILCDEIKERHGLDKRPRQCKHYYQNQKGWVVSIKQKGVVQYIGLFETEKLAKEVVNKCTELNWNIPACKRFVEAIKCGDTL